jgi:multisubunit Na+/H+ antiporter MnhB subunit
MAGLGIGGAILINICGAGTLVFLLVFGRLEIPQRGYIILWFIGLIVLLISVIEIIASKNKIKQS